MRKKDYRAVGRGIYSTWFNLQQRGEKLTDRQLFTLMEMLIINLSQNDPKFDKLKFVENALSYKQLEKFVSKTWRED